MKKLFLFITLIFTILALGSCEQEILEQSITNFDTNTEKSKVLVHKSKLQNREFISESLSNSAIGNTNIRKLQVYTPPGYSINYEPGYPVIYLLHGLPFSEKAFIDSSIWDSWVRPDGFFKLYPDFPENGFQAWIDQLILDQKIDPVIIVMPNAENQNYGFSWYSDSDLNGNFELYVANDVVNFIDKRYNTIKNKYGRAVIGHSQGGYGAIKMGMKHADKFSVIAAHGAPLFFNAIPFMYPYIVQENPTGLNGPDPSKFLTSGYYSMAAAWSPNLFNPPFMVDLPMEFPTGILLENIWVRWLDHDPFFMLDSYHDNFRSLKGIFIDCGALDEFGWGLTYPYFIEKMDAYSIDYRMESFYGGHFDQLFLRLEKSLMYCADKMEY